MVSEKYLILNKIRISSLAQFTLLLTVAVFAPVFHNQILTGSLVNATLFIAAAVLGLEGAILIGLLPSLFALMVGTLPFALAPLIPFIMLSNILLVTSFVYLKKTNYWLKIISAALLKFIFLFAVSTLVINLLFKGKIAGLAATMLSWPQFLTALLGGVLAYLVLKGGKFINSENK